LGDHAPIDVPKGADAQTARQVGARMCFPYDISEEAMGFATVDISESLSLKR